MTWRLLKRDLLLAIRRGGGTWNTLAFCLIVFCVFAFGLGPEALQRNAARVLAVTVLLSTLLALPGLFENDHEDGTLEQYLLQPAALEWTVAAKLAAFWLGTALPLLLITPLLGLMSGMGTTDLAGLMLALILATPTLACIGALGAALTLGLRRGGILQTLIVLPLYIPPLIFIAAVTEATLPLALLAAMLLAAVPLACWLCAALLRVVVE